MAADVEEELDRLYGLPPGEFVAARNELARALRKEGRADEAAEVAALRKPALPVWAANQLARRRRRDVDLLLDAGHRLRAAQSERDPETARQAFDRAREAENEIVRRLVDAAAELLEAAQGSAGRPVLDRVAATLRAATVSEEGRELLARGRLTEELTTSGFELAASLVPPAGGRKKRTAARAPGKTEKVEAARAERDAARDRAREASRALRDAERLAGKARRALQQAEDALDRARAEDERASAAADEAADALERARRPG